jgi:hypothetical protein
MTLAEWLIACGSIEDVQSVNVRIGDESWQACRYTQISEHNGKQYRTPRIYCVGQYPKSYNPNRKEGGSCYPFNKADWYIICYITEVKPGVAVFHPFGPNFILQAWDDSNPIDKHEQPYTRIPMVVGGGARLTG